MRHDYDLPADWDAMSDQERADWMTQERARRQALRQDTPTARHVEKARDRQQRRADARAEGVDVEKNR